MPKTELHLVNPHAQDFFKAIPKHLSFLPNNAPPAIYLLTTLASVPEALLTQRPQHISTVLKAAQVVTLLWLFDHCCQHTEMRGEGYDPAVRLKFTLHHQREDRHVTTPPNDSSRKKKEEIKVEKWGETGCRVGGVSHGLLLAALLY